MNCDGYPQPKPRKQRKRQPASKGIRTAPEYAPIAPLVIEFPSMTDSDRLYFQQWTTKQLSVSADSTNFWLRYALPMAYRLEPIRYSMVTVGASHRLFMARSGEVSNSLELERLAVHQYNKAIASIVPSMSTRTSSNIHCILICCLLFIAFEGLTGRYNELLRHVSAGNALFRSHLPISSFEERAVTEKLAEMFCRVGIESSNFMEDDPQLSGLSQWYNGHSTEPGEHDSPFKDLDEASYALRQLDLGYSCKPWHFEGGARTESRNNAAQAANATLQNALRLWSLRFDTFIDQPSVTSQYHNLHLRQQYWQAVIDAYASKDAPSDPKTFSPFLTSARAAAAPFIVMGQRTFSLDGHLISGLTFIMSTTKAYGTKSEALNLLRKLNRREGILDSNDIVKMHELAKALEESSADFLPILPKAQSKAQAGIPRIIEGLSRSLGKAHDNIM